jgi:hypothetical protein
MFNHAKKHAINISSKAKTIADEKLELGDFYFTSISNKSKTDSYLLKTVFL